MADFKKISDLIKNIAKDLNIILDELDVKEEPKEEPKVSFEELRATCTAKARAGFNKEVRALIQKYGKNKLSEIDEKDYSALLKEVEELSNAS